MNPYRVVCKSVCPLAIPYTIHAFYNLYQTLQRWTNKLDISFTPEPVTLQQCTGNNNRHVDITGVVKHIRKHRFPSKYCVQYRRKHNAGSGRVLSGFIRNILLLPLWQMYAIYETTNVATPVTNLNHLARSPRQTTLVEIKTGLHPLRFCIFLPE